MVSGEIFVDCDIAEAADWRVDGMLGVGFPAGTREESGLGLLMGLMLLLQMVMRLRR